jgi:hypothetical protein
MRKRLAWVLGLVGSLGMVSVLLAQAPAPAGGSALEQLLDEVRALRVDLSRTSGASIRMQLLTARLQLQEQRIFTTARQLTEVQGQLAASRAETLEVQQRVERLNAP